MARRGENIYKRKDGRYEGRYVKGHRLDGKPMFGYIYGYTYAEVKNNLTFAKAASGMDKPMRVVGKGTLGEYFQYWLDFLMRDKLKPSTYAQYRERIERHILPALGKAPLSRMTQTKAQEFADRLFQKGLSSSTISNIVGLLRSALKRAQELRLINFNPCDGVTLPKTEFRERRALDRTEQKHLEELAAAAGGITETAVFLALYTGLRIGEICALRWRDIDLQAGTLTVRATIQRVRIFDTDGAKTTVQEGNPKSRRALRHIPMPAGMTGKLRQYVMPQTGDCYVLTGSTKPMEPRTLRARFTRLAEQSGLQIPFHALRHTFSTRCLEHHFDVQTLSELLGHASAKTTLQVYAHSVFDHKRLLTDRIHILSEMNEPSNKPSDVFATYG